MALLFREGISMAQSTSSTPTAFVAGNWKMNGLQANVAEVESLAAKLDALAEAPCDVAICPPATLLAGFAKNSPSPRIGYGAQDCHPAANGAHTGDISAEMVKDAGGTYVIVGHSERRTDHGETSDLVCQKASAAIDTGLIAIICVGETHEQRTGGQTLDIVGEQLAKSVPDAATPENTVIAYEPVWAIGTGLTPTSEQIEEVHTFMRAELVARFGADANLIRLQYGGSVKPGNASEILKINNVNGALVGGASLKADDFYGIISAYLD